MVKTKIIATVGPATWRLPVIRKMIKSGLAVARVNGSFADAKEMQRVQQHYQRVNPTITMMADTVGFKIRLNKTNPEITVRKGDLIRLSSHPTKDLVLGLDYESFEKEVAKGEQLFIDDGLIQAVIVEVTPDVVTARCLVAGVIKKGKTVSLPDTKVKFLSPLSAKDSLIIQQAVELGYDFLNISFVRSIEDIRAVRQAIGNAKISLVAKIENAEGIQNSDEIISQTDALMIPRGDLAIETPFENLPVLQKELSIKAAQYGKPVIYASQILDSMKSSKFPLRAEISDLGNAVYDRADSIMLAQETAIGLYPVTTVQAAAKILGRVEESIHIDPLFEDSFILDIATTNAKNPKTKQTVEKALQVDYQFANGFKFTCPYGIDAYTSMQEFWYDYEPLVFLSKLRKSLALSFSSVDSRAVRQMGILFGVTLHND